MKMISDNETTTDALKAQTKKRLCTYGVCVWTTVIYPSV